MMLETLKRLSLILTTFYLSLDNTLSVPFLSTFIPLMLSNLPHLPPWNSSTIKCPFKFSPVSKLFLPTFSQNEGLILKRNIYKNKILLDTFIAQEWILPLTLKNNLLKSNNSSIFFFFFLLSRFFFKCFHLKRCILWIWIHFSALFLCVS